MNTIDIVHYDVQIPDQLNDFVEMFYSIQFKYNTSHLIQAGLMDPEEIGNAMNIAMKVCRLNGIDVREHFKSLYVFDEKRGGLYCDWHMTRQGFTLVVINATSVNAELARWQWELVNALT